MLKNLNRAFQFAIILDGSDKLYDKNVESMTARERAAWNLLSETFIMSFGWTLALYGRFCTITTVLKTTIFVEFRVGSAFCFFSVS